MFKGFRLFQNLACMSAILLTLMTGSAQNLLSINPSTFQFSSSAVGITQDIDFLYISVANQSGAPVTITGIALTGGAAQDFAITKHGDDCTAVMQLPWGVGCNIFLSFTPSAVGIRTTQLVVATQGGASQSVLVVGQGLPLSRSFVFSPSNVTFPPASIGLPSTIAPTSLIQVKNTGSAPLFVQSVSLAGANPEDFHIASSTCLSVVIPLANSCGTTIVFQPTALGPRTAYLAVSSNATAGTQYLPLAGSGISQVNQLTVTPNAWDLGQVALGVSSQFPFQIQNTGSEAVTIRQMQVTGANAADFALIQNSCASFPKVLAAQQQCAFDIQFSPAANGVRLAQLVISSTADGSPQTIPLAGNGVPNAPNISWGPPFLDFGPGVVGQAMDPGLNVNSSVFNSGNAPAQVSLQFLGTNAHDFHVISNNGCQGGLAPFMSCSVILQFVPTAPGVRVATIAAKDTGSGQTVYLPMIGIAQGSAGPLTVGSDTPFSGFFSVPVGNVSNPVSFTINNTSSTPVTLTGTAIAGNAASDFHVTENTCLSKAVLGSCHLQVTFQPSAAGFRFAAVGIGYAGASTPFLFPLAGMGTAPAETISFQQSSLIAPERIGEQRDYPITLLNTGSLPVTISNVAVVGQSSNVFSVSQSTCPTAPQTLPPAAQCQITVRFAPTTVGTVTAQLQVTDDASGSPQNLMLTGFALTGSPVSNMLIGTNVLNFGLQPLGTSAQQQVGILFNGTYPLSFGKVAITGPNASDFTLTNGCPASMSQPGSQCQIFITFTPAVTGQRVAQLEISDNAAGSPQIVPLSGVGVKSSQFLTSSPSPVAFQQVGVGQINTITVTLTSGGTAPLTMSAIQIQGQNAGDFGMQSNSCPMSPTALLPGTTCQVVLRFQPTATGLRFAVLQVTDNAPGGVQSFGLVGAAVPAIRTLALLSSSVAFSATPVGGLGAGQVFLVNVGSVPVTITNISFGGANPGDFSTSSTTGPLRPGDNKIIFLNFTPSAPGARTATLTITSDATNSPQTVTLSGTGQ